LPDIGQFPDLAATLIDAAQVIIVVLDPSGRIVLINPFMEQLSGYRLSEVKGRDWFDTFLPPEDRAPIRELFQTAVNDLQTHGNINCILTRDGRRRDIEWYDKTLKDRKGRTTGLLSIGIDVTERIKTERALRENERNLDITLQSIGDAVIVADRAGRIQRMNGRAEQLTGWNNREAAGQPLDAVFRIVNQTTGKPAADPVRRVLQTGTIQGLANDTVLIARDGARRVIADSAAPIADSAGGQAAGVVLIFRDITREYELRKSLTDERRLFITGPTVVFKWRAEADWPVEYVSPNVEKGFGYKPDVFISGAVKYAALVHPEDLARVSEEVRAHVAAGQDSYEQKYRLRHANGQYRTVEDFTMIVRDADGRPTHFLGYVIDVTQQKQAEAENRRLAMAVHQAAEAVMITDTDGVIQYVNPAFETITGYTAGEVLARNPRLLKSGRHPPEFYAQMWTELRRGETWRGHVVNRRKDGSLYEADLSITPIRDHTGQTVNFVSVSHDVTREMQLAQQFQRAQRMEAVGRLAGGIAHDFNNLLTSILGYSKLLLDEGGPHDPFRHDLEQIERAAERAADLTRQLLTISRKQLAEVRNVDLNAIVMELSHLFRRTLGEDIEMTTQLGEELGNIMADPGQIQQVLMNLLVNARDAMPQGGKLTLETTNVVLGRADCQNRIDVHPGPYVRLRLTDTGIGMGPEVKEHLFEPFFTTKPEGKGTGLGLSTVYGIIRQCGGFIEFDTELGRGTEFRIFFPRAQTPVEQAVLLAEQVVGGTETILVVEDEEMVRRLTVRLLTSLGYRVLQAAHGREALQIAERHEGPIHMVLTDVVMPHINGPALVEELLTIRKGIKVLYMSGFAAEAIAEHGLTASSETPLVHKPYNMEDLAAKVREILDRPSPAETAPGV